MRSISKNKIKKDDSLFGLLSTYKSYSSYFRVLENDALDEVAMIIVSNPGNWKNIPQELLEGFVDIRRLKLGLNRMSLKYLLPEHLATVMGPSLGIKIPANKLDSVNRLSTDGFYILRTSRKYMPRLMTGLKRLINLTPQKKYEILEKSFVKDSE